MTFLKRALQGKDRDDRIRERAQEFIARSPQKLFLIGHVATWAGFRLDTTERVLDEMVAEGLLRLASKEELRELGFRHGYFLTEEGLKLVPEWKKE